jgi:hypothetical protein
MIRRSAAGVFQLWLSLLACISHALSATSVVLINDDNSEGTDCQLYKCIIITIIIIISSGFYLDPT